MRVVALLLAALAAAPAGACLDLAVDSLVAAVEGRAFDHQAAARCRPPNLDTPPAGSGNWPILVSAARYVAGHDRDGRWLYPWLSGAGGKWGHNGRESGSTIYEGVNWAAAIAVRHKACHGRPGDGRLCAAAGDWLKSGLAKWALSMTTRPPARVHYRQGRAVASRSRITSTGYFGPFAHLVGDRQGEKPGRGEWMGSWVEQTPVHAVVAWAADVPGRRYGAIKPQERSLPLWVAQKVARVSYGQPLPPVFVGLSTGDRATLRRFLQDPTDRAGAAELARWLSMRPSRSSTVTYRRYRSGDVVTVLSSTTNANKSGAVVAAGLRGTSHWLLPSTYRGVGAATARGELLEQRAIGVSNDGGRLELGLSGLGSVAWEVVWNSSGAQLFGADGPGEGPPPPPPGQIPVATIAQPCVDVLSRVHRIQTAPSTSRRMAELYATLGEAFRRLCFADQLAGEQRAAALASAAKAGDTFAAKSRRR